MCSELNSKDPEVIGGILNGAPPFRADMTAEGTDMSILWVVYDAEDSVIARVDAGEEMAVFIAAELNRLASVPEYVMGSPVPDSAQ